MNILSFIPNIVGNYKKVISKGVTWSDLHFLKIPLTKIMASGPITSWEVDGETVEIGSDFILGGLQKSLQMVTAAMKLKDAYSLEEKLWPP